MQITALTDLVIPNAGTDSNVIDDARSLGGANCITIHAPAALTGTVKVYVSPDGTVALGVIHQDPAGTDIAIAAGKAVTIKGAFASLFLRSSGAEAAERTFKIAAQFVRW